MNLTCYCDGGYSNLTKSNGYGSFRVYEEGVDFYLARMKFESISSSNESEYQTLISLLEWVVDNYDEVNLTIYSDSKLMCNQLNGLWEVRSKSLTPFYQTAVVLLNEIQEWKLEWQPRSVLVKQLGH